VTVAVVIAAILAVPGRNRDASQRRQGALSSGATTEQGGTPHPSTAAGGGTESNAQQPTASIAPSRATANVVASPIGASGPGRSPKAGGSGVAAVGGVVRGADASTSGPGVGTPAALANPKCDPKTGRFKFPSLFFPECV